MTPDNRVSTIGRWWPPLVWTGLIFAASSVPGSSLEAVALEIPDKIVHGIEYAVLGFLVFVANRGGRMRSHWRAFAAAVSWGLLVGIVDENYQRLIPLRDPSPADWVADVVGAALGATLAWCTGFEGRGARGRDR